VIVEGRDLAESTLCAEQIVTDLGMTFVHPFDDPLVIAGQGTIAPEMLCAVPDFDALVAPIGMADLFLAWS
jgi:threonine dehydratase